jgi:hypothetical protein
VLPALGSHSSRTMSADVIKAVKQAAIEDGVNA